jgi:chromosome segregation ATPase
MTEIHKNSINDLGGTVAPIDSAVTPLIEELQTLTANTIRHTYEIKSLDVRISALDDEIFDIERDGNDIDDALAELKRQRGRANSKRDHIVNALAEGQGRIEAIKVQVLMPAVGALVAGFTSLSNELLHGLDSIRHQISIHGGN